MPRPPLDGVIVLTGASSGIGRSLALQLAPRAKAIALVARRRELLDGLAAELEKAAPSCKTLVMPCDLSDIGASDTMIGEVEAALGPVDVLINNAGFGDMEMFEVASYEKLSRMITLNVTSLTFLTHRVLAGMVKRGRGGIMNVSSGFGLTFGPGLAAYVATKNYVSALTESIRCELAGTGVAMTQLCPGPVATEFMEHTGNFTGQDPPGFVTISADQCARAAIAGFSAGRAIVVPGLLMKLVMLSAALTPRWVLRLVYHPVARAMRKKRFEAKPA
jgi:hypothetical protein